MRLANTNRGSLDRSGWYDVSVAFGQGGEGWGCRCRALLRWRRRMYVRQSGNSATASPSHLAGCGCRLFRQPLLKYPGKFKSTALEHTPCLTYTVDVRESVFYKRPIQKRADVSSQSRHRTATTQIGFPPIRWKRKVSAVLVLLHFLPRSYFSCTQLRMQQKTRSNLENGSTQSTPRLPRTLPLATQFLSYWNRLRATSSTRTNPIPGLRSTVVGAKEGAGSRDGKRRGSRRAWRTKRTRAAVWMRLVQPRLYVSEGK